MNGDYLSSNAAKMISRRKPRNGDGGLKMPNNERSAEYWRGVLETAKQAGYSKLAIYGYEQLLATAEAREATQPTAAQVVEACEKALEELAMTGRVTTHRAALALCARWKEANGGK